MEDELDFLNDIYIEMCLLQGSVTDALRLSSQQPSFLDVAGVNSGLYSFLPVQNKLDKLTERIRDRLGDLERLPNEY